MPSRSTPRTLFGRRLREARLKMGIAQDKLGVMIGIDEVTSSARISRYETGVHEPPFAIAVLLSNALHVPAAFFYWVFSASGSAANQTAGFIATTGHVKSPPSLPPSYTFPHGLFDFVLEGGDPGTPATITITYPTTIPANSVYWKYGPSPAGYNCSGAACETAHWYQMPPAQAVIAGNTITLTITDGGVGDDDLAENGTIVDQGGPGVPVAATSIPTLSEWGMIILSSLMAMFGYVHVRQRKGSAT